MNLTLEEYQALFTAINDRTTYLSNEEGKGELLPFELTQWHALDSAYLKLKKEARGKFNQ